MKHKTAIVITLFLFFALMIPNSVSAYTKGAEVYNDHDYNALVAFLKQTSAKEAVTNAQILKYDLADPAGWAGVQWVASGDELRLRSIDWSKAAGLGRRIERKRLLIFD